MKITLKAARVNAGFSQDELAKFAGVSKSTISRWEIGRFPIPDEMLARLCEICQVNKEDISLMKGTDK